jgi:glycosyltransferase involved in cell wall biosynthesis
MDQTYPNLEVVIVDDGSTDGTDRFWARHSFGFWGGKCLKYYRQDNAGASAARNRGLAQASGKYLQFLDSDDVLFKSKIALQVAVMEEPKAAQAEGCACFGQLGISTEDQTSITRIGVYCRTPHEYLCYLSSRLVHGMQTSAPLWRRSFLTSRPGWRTDINLGDDLEYYIRLLAQCSEMKFVDKELFFVRDHRGPRLSDHTNRYARTLSAIQTRVSIFEVLLTSGHWDEKVQVNFLGAMRPIYANLLTCGTSDDIQRLEAWLLKCSRIPLHRQFFPALIILRRFVGTSTILAAHRLVMATR